jgi:hypothetical protein
MNAEKERRRQVEQAENAKRELDEARARRAHERELRAERYGILDRKYELASERLRQGGLRCTCGAIQSGGTIHKEECPVVREARSKNR